MTRACGILLSVLSLPGAYGAGTMADAAAFLDVLADAAQRFWQILPVGTVGESFSPYQSFSAFAGNPLFISPEYLCRLELVTREELEEARLPAFSKINYAEVMRRRAALLKKAFERNRTQRAVSGAEARADIGEYCLFAALRKYFDAPLAFWPEDIKRREGTAVERYTEMLGEEIAFRAFMQDCFFDEWAELRKRAKRLGVGIVGDIPIYVSADSADVWAHPESFLLDERLMPTVTAGVPPDAFSVEGQHWDCPIYDYSRMHKDGFSWWKRRICHAFTLYDVLRIDHFRGFDEYYEIPAGKSAAEGAWQKGPGAAMVDAVNAAASGQIIAEDLGGDTQGARELLAYSGFPGMRVLEFAFDSDGQNRNLPHMYPENCVAYTGTHDNDTVMGWFYSASRPQRAMARKYLGLNNEEGIHNGFIRGVLSSPASLAVIPAQDYLGLFSEARMNTPGTVGGNWMWRMTEDLRPEQLAKMAKIYGRA